jgi:hypothetical protein
MLQGIVKLGTLPTSVGVSGDYNANGIVDAADYVLWRNGGPLQNEVATIGTVTADDYAAWRARFGNTAGSGSGMLTAATVPDPATMSSWLLLLPIIATARFGRSCRAACGAR